MPARARTAGFVPRWRPPTGVCCSTVCGNGRALSGRAPTGGPRSASRSIRFRAISARFHTSPPADDNLRANALASVRLAHGAPIPCRRAVARLIEVQRAAIEAPDLGLELDDVRDALTRPHEIGPAAELER